MKIVILDGYTANPGDLSWDFFEKYRDNVAASVSQSVNNSYLQSQGAVAGTKSYNMVVDLAVAFFQSTKP